MTPASEASAHGAGALRRQDRLARDLLGADRQVRDDAERELLRAPEENLPALLEALAVPGPTPPGAVGRVALLIGALGARAGLKPLLERGADASVGHEDRAAIARAVSELLTGADAFDTDVMTGLERLSRDMDRTVRAYAADAFSVLGDERSKARVRALAEDADPYVRARADRALARIAEAVRVPVVANGEIWSVDDYLRCRSESGLADVMMGRGAVADPLLVERIRARLRGDEAIDPALDWPRIAPLLGDYWQRVLGHVEARHAAGRLKQWLNLLRRVYPQAELLYQAMRPVRDNVRIGELLAAVLPLQAGTSSAGVSASSDGGAAAAA